MSVKTGGGLRFGGSRGTFVTMDHIFESVSARDAYFDSPNPHLTELIIGTPIVVNIAVDPDPADVRFQVWAGDNLPSTYPNPITDEWADAGNAGLTIPQAQLLAGLAAVDNNRIPKKNTSSYENSALIEAADRVTSDKPLHAPEFVGNTGSLKLGDASVSFAGAGLELADPVNSRQCGIVAKVVGSGRVEEYSDVNEATEDLQLISDQNSGSFNFSYTVTNQVNRDGVRAVGFTVIPHAAGEGTFSIKKTDTNGPELVTETTMTAQAGDVGSEFSVTFANAFRVNDGDAIYVEYSGAAVRGGIDTPAGSGFFPYLKVTRQEFTTETLARSSDLDGKEDSLGNPITNGQILSSTTAGNRSWIDASPPGSDADAIHDNVAGEINAITEKATPANGDVIIIEDSGDSFNKKKIFLTDLLSNNSPLFSSVANLETQTGVFDITNLGSTFYHTGTQITGLRITDNSIPDDTVYAIYNQKNISLNVELTGAAVNYLGRGSGKNFSIASEETILFYVKFNGIYPVVNYNAIAGGSTGDHPIIVTRDTPSLSELDAIANASIDDNSGFWLVANDQIQATEDLVDTSIMIRALRDGLLDANGDAISTTAVQKRGLVLGAGSQVRIFSSTDLRVVATPGSSAMAERFPDVPFTGALEITNQGTYNSYLRRTATNAGGSNQYLRMPSLHTVDRPSWVVAGDVFVMRHTGSTTGTQRPHFRPNNTGDSIAGHGLQYFADPGETIAIQAPAFGIRTWQLFPVAQRSDGITYYDPEAVGEFFIDELDTLSTRNPLSLYNRHDLNDGIVRDHIRTASFSANPISLAFQRKNYQDSIAWIQWWSAFAAVPPLGTIAEEILDNIPTSLAWIEININNGFDFEFNAPGATISISAITNDGGNSFRIELSSALPTYFAVNDNITIAGATNAGNNGLFIIDSIAGDRLLFNITNASGVNESGSGAFTQKTIYCDAVLVSHDLKQTNFNCYEDSGRTTPTTINPNWFDPSYTGAESVLAIGYNTDVLTIPPAIRFEDDNGDFFTEFGGNRGQVFYFDNAGGNYQNVRYLPLNQEDIHIRTDGTCDFYFDLHPEDLPSGQRRRVSVYSNILNDNDDVEVSIGRPESIISFDEGIGALSILNGTNQVFELYNDGQESGIRLVQPFEKYIPSASLTNVVTPSVGPLAMSIGEIVAAESQDPNFSFYSITNNKITCKGRFRYLFTFRLKLRFDGAEDTGLSFVNASLVPTRERNAVTTDLSRETGNSTVKIDFVRNGDSGDDNTKPIYTLTANLSYFAEPNDQIGFELRLGQFPSGYSISDLRQIERQYTITVKGGID